MAVLTESIDPPEAEAANVNALMTRTESEALIC